MVASTPSADTTALEGVRTSTMPAGSVELLPKRMTTSMCRPSPLTAGVDPLFHLRTVSRRPASIRACCRRGAPFDGDGAGRPERFGRSTLHISRCQAARF